MERFNIRKIKSINGNVTILVLIMSMVIIISMVTLTGYMFRDVIFTKFDEGKFKALNIAEAGVAYTYSNIEKFYDGEIGSIPSSYDDVDVENSDGVIQGSFDVEIDEITNDDGEVTNYIITSEGTDLESGYSRKVTVNLALFVSTEVDIFDYIYSKGSLTFEGIIGVTFIRGPLFVGGDLILRILLQAGDFTTDGRILVGGDVDMEGPSRIRTGPLNVAGDIEMSSGLLGIPYILHDYDDYMVVMGDIRIGDNFWGDPWIARDMAKNPFNLALHGEIVPEDADIYYSEPLGEEIFDPPNFDVEIYINDFIEQIKEPPYSYLEVDESEDGTAGDGFNIDPALIASGEYFKESGSNSIRFRESGGSYYLEVKGNVFVDDDIIIGDYIEDYGLDPPDNDIYYSNKGKLISSGDIYASCGLVPTSTSQFPENNLLILMALGDLYISVEDNEGYNDNDVYILGMAGGKALLKSQNTVLGSIICGQIDAEEEGFWGRLLGSLASIEYEDDLSENIPDDLPREVYGGFTFSPEWQEVSD
jgi:hypothetical protein